jgi:hypothetical protein
VLAAGCDIDWRNIDRSKIKFDRDQFKKLDGDGLRDRVKADGRNDFEARPLRSGGIVPMRFPAREAARWPTSARASSRPG